MRYLTSVLILVAASTACSRAPERNVAASPTSPTALTLVKGTDSLAGGVSGPMDVSFPGRQESLQFRNELEVAYQTVLGRSLSSTFVDKEGEVVWIQEYIRYRVNGCDHATAVSRVADQIANRPAGGICGAPPEGLVLFPSRADVFDFRRQLENIYQQMGRAAGTSYVDMEGAAIWIAEYLRYRTNACDHPTGSQKTLAQLSGAPPPATCFVPCNYIVFPGGIDLGPNASSQTFELRPNPTSCAWTASSDAPWLMLPSDYHSGNGYTNIPYSVTANNGGERVGSIRFAWGTGGTSFRVVQAGTPFIAGFNLVDPFRGPAATTECHFRSASTSCTLTAYANLPGNTYTYAWSVSYFYGVQKTFSQTGSGGPTLTITDGCGGPESTAEGTFKDLSVTLTISDELGNSITIRSGEGSSPALGVRLFTC